MGEKRRLAQWQRRLLGWVDADYRVEDAEEPYLPLEVDEKPMREEK